MRCSRAGSVNQRFFYRYVVDKRTSCWNWLGALNNHGYGVIGGVLNGRRYVPKGTNMLAHRVSWIIHFGDIPESEGAHGMVVMHKCDNRKCVNPSHLMLGRQFDNVQDMIAKGRKVSGVPSGVNHWNSVIKSHDDISLICSTKGKTKALAEKFGVCESTIQRLRKANGAAVYRPERFKNKPVTKEMIAHIRSTKSGTRGLTKMYGLSKTAISKIRKGLTHPD